MIHMSRSVITPVKRPEYGFLAELNESNDLNWSKFPLKSLVCNCLWCGAKQQMYLTPMARRYLWGYCDTCKRSEQLVGNIFFGESSSVKVELWNYYRKHVALFTGRRIPYDLTAILGISYDIHDPFRKNFLEGIVGFVPNFGKFHRYLKFGTTRRWAVCKGLTRADINYPALILPICRFPGYLTGFQVVHPQGLYIMKLDQNVAPANDLIFLNLHDTRAEQAGRIRRYVYDNLRDFMCQYPSIFLSSRMQNTVACKPVVDKYCKIPTEPVGFPSPNSLLLAPDWI